MKLLDQQDLESVSTLLCSGSRRYSIDARLESYSCKMVSEEKRQYKDLLARLRNSNDCDLTCLRLGSSETLRKLCDLTGRQLDPLTYQLSTCQDHSTQLNTSVSSSSNTPTGGGRKRGRSETAYSSDDGTSPPARLPTCGIKAKDFFCLMSTLNSCFGPAYDFLSARSDEFCLEPELWVVKHYISRFCSIYVDKYEDISLALWKAMDEEVVPQHCLIYSYRPDRLSDPYSSGCLASFNFFFHNRLMKRVLFFSLRVLNQPLVLDDFDEDMQDIY